LTPNPPTPTFLAQLAAELEASDALFLQRKYSDAFLRATPGGPFSLAGYSHTFESIRRWIAGGGDFTPELADDAKRAGLGGAECLHLLELYFPAAQSYAVVALGNPIPIALTDTDIAYIWLQWATIALDWGNALFRNSDVSNDDLAAALAIYQSVVVVNPADSVASVPQTGASPLYDIPILKPPADQASKIIQNLAQLVQGNTTAQALQVNPTQAGVIVEVFQNIVKIQNGLDFWGHWRNTVPIWTFDYLQSVAINFTQLAMSAERDFIDFQDKNDQAQFSRQQLVQTASQANAEVDAASAQVKAAGAELDAYSAAQKLADARAADATASADAYATSSDLAIQFDAVRTQLAGGNSGDFSGVNNLADDLIAGRGIWWRTGGRFGNSGTVDATAAVELAAARLNRQYEVDSLNRTSSEMALAAQQAQQETVAAVAKVNAALAAETVARLHAEGAQQSLQAFDSQTFTPDVWQRMADAMRRLYRRYLGMALNTALLMQRAYNYETDQALSFIKSDYSSNEVKGLLGAEALLADIETFTYDLITSRAGKPQPLRQTISLAQNYAFAFERQFRTTGIMEFETRIDDFDYVYPGTYAGRIENVEVEVVGIVPVGGLSGTLTNSGISGYRMPSSVSVPGASGLKYRLQSKETLVLSDYTTRNDTLLLPGDSRMTRIFQGAGLVSTWRLELPKAVNDIDFGTLLDVRLTFYYKARYDPDLHDRVLAELASRPGVNSRQRPLQLRWVYPDSFFAFQDTGQLKWSLTASDFRFNEIDPILTSLGAVLVTNGSVSPAGLEIGLSTPGQAPQSAVTNAAGAIDSGADSPAWQMLAGNTALGDYVLTMTAEGNPSLVKDGALDLSPIVNIALVFAYSFTPRQ
jgi:hypothetical protein